MITDRIRLHSVLLPLLIQLLKKHLGVLTNITFCSLVTFWTFTSVTSWCIHTNMKRSTRILRTLVKIWGRNNFLSLAALTPMFNKLHCQPTEGLLWKISLLIIMRVVLIIWSSWLSRRLHTTLTSLVFTIQNNTLRRPNYLINSVWNQIFDLYVFSRNAAYKYRPI